MTGDSALHVTSKPGYPSSPPRTRDELPASGPGALGTVWARILARFIDGLLISMPLTVPFLHIVDNEAKLDPPMWAAVALIVVPMLYDFACIAAFGMTLGKRIMGLRVVRYVDGGRAAPYQAGLRAMVPNLPSFMSFLPGLEFMDLLSLGVYLTALFDPVLRGLHDKAAGTIVIRTR